jgi:hypothetical protein
MGRRKNHPGFDKALEVSITSSDGTRSIAKLPATAQSARPPRGLTFRRKPDSVPRQGASFELRAGLLIKEKT